MNRIGAALLAVLMLSFTLTACDEDQCGDGSTVCDENGQELVYAPYLVPAYGNYGQPGYIAPHTIYPGAPGYVPTYQGKPPNYTPPVQPRPPSPNPNNIQPTAPVKPAAPPGYKPPSVNAPRVNAPRVNAPRVGK